MERAIRQIAKDVVRERELELAKELQAEHMSDLSKELGRFLEGEKK